MKKMITILLSAVMILSVLLTLPPLQAKAAAFAIDFDTACQSVYLENLDTGTVIYSKKPNDRRFPASTTKIMTYIITVENIKDLKNTMVTVKESTLKLLKGTGSSVAGIRAKETLSVYQLLCCLMIPSGNDAAIILADYVGNGSIQDFVDMMNDKAKQLGCTGTHFANPHGLNNPNHYTTVSDMAKITKHALSLPEFESISNMTSSDCLGEDRTLYTTNYMIDPVRGGDYYYEYAKGIKTGSTGNDSGYCLVSTASRDGYTYLCIAYGAPYEDENGEYYDNGAMLDSQKLYQWAFGNFGIKTVIDTNDLVKEVKLRFAWNRDSLQLAPAKSFSALLPHDLDLSSIDRAYNIPESIDAPVKAGDKIGTVTLSYADEKLATIDLVASETVERSDLLIALDTTKNIVTSGWFMVVIIIVVGLVFGYIILAAVYNHRKRNRRPVKKYRKF